MKHFQVLAALLPLALSAAGCAATSEAKTTLPAEPVAAPTAAAKDDDDNYAHAARPIG